MAYEVRAKINTTIVAHKDLEIVVKTSKEGKLRTLLISRLLDTGDQAYRAFVEQAWALRDQLTRTAAPALTPRQLDRFLLKQGM
jgi:hypothetical protein